MLTVAFEQSLSTVQLQSLYVGQLILSRMTVEAELLLEYIFLLSYE